jgi:hypothetical protein
MREKLCLKQLKVFLLEIVANNCSLSWKEQ